MPLLTGLRTGRGGQEKPGCSSRQKVAAGASQLLGSAAQRPRPVGKHVKEKRNTSTEELWSHSPHGWVAGWLFKARSIWSGVSSAPEQRPAPASHRRNVWHVHTHNIAADRVLAISCKGDGVLQYRWERGCMGWNRIRPRELWEVFGLFAGPACAALTKQQPVIGSQEGRNRASAAHLDPDGVAVGAESCKRVAWCIIVAIQLCSRPGARTLGIRKTGGLRSVLPQCLAGACLQQAPAPHSRRAVE